MAEKRFQQTTQRFEICRIKPSGSIEELVLSDTKGQLRLRLLPCILRSVCLEFRRSEHLLRKPLTRLWMFWKTYYRLKRFPSVFFTKSRKYPVQVGFAHRKQNKKIYCFTWKKFPVTTFKLPFFSSVVKWNCTRFLDWRLTCNVFK